MTADAAWEQPDDVRRVVVVGLGLAGWHTVRGLRSRGFTGEIVVIGDEEGAPYDRPPLTKAYLAGRNNVSTLSLATDEQLSDAAIERVTGTAVSVTTGEVTLADGTVVHGDVIVLATGSRAARPEVLDGFDDVHTVRTRGDVDALRRRLRDGSSLLVLGGGFVGAEVASTARSAGHEVTMVEAQDELFSSSLGALAGGRIRQLHEDAGVEVVVGRAVDHLERTGDGVVAVLDDGRWLVADVVVAAMGARLNTEVLDATGIDTANGVPCDERGRVVELPGVHAVGDVARWHDPVLGRRVRREHWSTAGEHAAIVAHAITGSELPAHLPSTPYFWSDQQGVKVQMLGWPELAEEAVWVSADSDGPPAVVELRREGRLVAAVTIGAPPLLRRYRSLLADGPAQPLTIGASE